jgi:hypothetical protein
VVAYFSARDATSVPSIVTEFSVSSSRFLAHYRDLLLLSGQLRSLAFPSGWRRPGAVRS